MTNPLIFLAIFMIEIFANNKLIQGLDVWENFCKVSNGCFNAEQLNTARMH